MLKNNNNPENGFITMIVAMLVVLGVVLFIAYSRVTGS